MKYFKNKQVKKDKKLENRKSFTNPYKNINSKWVTTQRLPIINCFKSHKPPIINPIKDSDVSSLSQENTLALIFCSLLDF